MKDTCCSTGACEQLSIGELELIAEFNSLGPWTDETRERKRKIRKELARLRVEQSPRPKHQPASGAPGAAVTREITSTRSERTYLVEKDEVAREWTRWLQTLPPKDAAEMRRLRGRGWSGGWLPEHRQEKERIGGERVLVWEELANKGGGWDVDRSPSREEIERQEQRWREVQKLLASLDERDRQLLTLHFLRGLSQREIAARLGISQPAVNKAIRKAIERARG